LAADAEIVARLGNPPPDGSGAWPLPTIPYTPEISGAPVSVTQVEANLWAFASHDAGGVASSCVRICSDTPELVLNPNYGLYQATLRVRPTLGTEFWSVLHVVITNEHGVPTYEGDAHISLLKRRPDCIFGHTPSATTGRRATPPSKTRPASMTSPSNAAPAY
jgi:hypothetical protein